MTLKQLLQKLPRVLMVPDSLRGQALTRLGVVFVVLATSLLAFGVSNYISYQQRDKAEKQQALMTYYADLLPRLNANWDNQSAQMRLRIEYTRILERHDNERFPALTAFLNAQWTHLDFSDLLILSRDGTVLYRYGPSAHAMSGLDVPGSGWLFLRSHEELYRVFTQPVWMGAAGEGALRLFKPVNAATLGRIAVPETHLTLSFAGVVLAENGPSVPALEGGWLNAILGASETASVLSWPGDPQHERPELLAQRTVNHMLPFSDFVLRPVAVIVIVAIVLWLVLGRWLGGIVRRLESLTRAAADYTRDGEIGAVVALLQPVRAQHDEIGGVADTLSHLVETVEERNREQRTHAETLALLEEAVLELDSSGRVLHASAGWTKITHDRDMGARTLFDYVHADDVDMLRAQCHALAAGTKTQISVRLRLDTANVHNCWVELRLLGYRGPQGSVIGIRGILRDITQTYLHEKQISHMALHDALSGLPNRVLLEDRCENALRLAARSGHKVGLCFIDIDHFKNVNDTLGHKIGDKLLIAFAERLRDSVRLSDTLARWGGDEFVLLMPEMACLADIREVTKKLSDALQVPLPLDDGELRVTFSMGAAVYPDDGEDTESLLSQADRAMFYAKAQGRNQVCFYRDMSTKGIGRKELYIQHRLAEAINAGRIQAWYQPIVDARSGACRTIEVLARWQDEQHGWVSPAVFVPMAENIGLIRELGQQMWLASLDAFATLRAAGYQLSLATNVSKRQLFMASFTEQSLSELARRHIAPSELVLEVTESVALRDVEHASDRLEELREAGFSISIDDFGTGYSSLSQLHEIDVNELKIDISFVRRLDTSKGYNLVRAIVNIAHTLGLKTVAEGVEDLDTARRLRELGVDYLQGYVFGRPMPRHELERWLAERRGRKVCG